MQVRKRSVVIKTLCLSDRAVNGGPLYGRLDFHRSLGSGPSFRGLISQTAAGNRAYLYGWATPYTHIIIKKHSNILTSRCSNHSAPNLQSSPRSFVRKLATFCRPLLDMNPVAAISRMFASTKGTPVCPLYHASNHFWFLFHCFWVPSRPKHKSNQARNYWSTILKWQFKLRMTLLSILLLLVRMSVFSLWPICVSWLIAVWWCKVMKLLKC